MWWVRRCGRNRKDTEEIHWDAAWSGGLSIQGKTESMGFILSATYEAEGGCPYTGL